MWQKRLLMALLLFSFCVCSFTAQSAQENLTKLEDYIINISNDALKQNEYVIELERLVEESEKQQKEQLKIQEMLQNQLKYYERKSKNWRIAAGVSISVSIISIGTLIIMMNN